MKTFSSVEDYLEVLAGKRDLVTGAPRPPVWLGYEFKPIVNLARYDVNFLDSVTDATLSGTALTDRQAELGIKMVQKYTRQLNAKGVSTDPLLSPVYRKPVRLIDRSRKLWIENDQLMLKFPYDTRMINELKDLLKDKQGPAGFDRDAKLWKISATEYNTNFVYYWGKSNQFEIDGAVDTLMQEILAVEIGRAHV